MKQHKSIIFYEKHTSYVLVCKSQPQNVGFRQVENVGF